jgi:aryl-alcohol dehydrogenase-like predicted oxidoreductase
MKIKQLAGTNLQVSDICYGAGGFGSSCSGADLDERIKVYRDAGGNFLDTAHCYAFWTPAGTGCSERAIGDYLRRNGRGNLVIATKGGHPTADGYRNAEHWLSSETIHKDLEESLNWLGVESIDLYWLHRDDTRVPAGQVIESLNAEIRSGKIRFLGASNWHRSRIGEANAYARTHGLQGFVANEPEWNLATRTVEPIDAPPGTGTEMRQLSSEDHEWHRRSGLTVIPYASTAGGFFATNGERAKNVYGNAVSLARLARAQTLAKQREVSSGQIALAWLLNQDIPVIPIIGSLDVGHLIEDLGAAEIRLTAAEVAWLAEGSVTNQANAVLSP